MLLPMEHATVKLDIPQVWAQAHITHVYDINHKDNKALIKAVHKQLTSNGIYWNFLKQKKQ